MAKYTKEEALAELRKRGYDPETDSPDNFLLQESVSKSMNKNKPKPTKIESDEASTNGDGAITNFIWGAIAPVDALVRGVTSLALPDDVGRRVRDWNENTTKQAYKENPLATGLGNIAGYAAPGGVVAKGVSKAVPAASRLMQSLLGGGLFGGAEGFLRAPDEGESRLGGGLEGAALGTAFGALGEGAMKAGSGLIKGAKRAVGSEQQVIKDMLRNIPQSQRSEMLTNAMSGQRLKAPLTPGEASGSKTVQAMEQRAASSPERLADLEAFKRSQKQGQQEAIEGLKDKISPKGNYARDAKKTSKEILEKKKEELQKKAKPHYDKARDKRLTIKQTNKLLNDPILEDAMERALKNKNYSKNWNAIKTKGPKEMTVGGWQLAKQELDALIKNKSTTFAGKQGSQTELSNLVDSKKMLVEMLKKESPSYKKAINIYADDMKPIEILSKGKIGKIADITEAKMDDVAKTLFDAKTTDPKTMEAIRKEFMKESPETWRGIVRNAMEERLDTSAVGKSGNYGSNFFKQIASKDAVFDKFYGALKGDKSAQLKLRDMKRAFKMVSDDLPKATGKKVMDIKQPIQTLKSMISGNYDQAVINIVTDPKWDTKFRVAIKALEKENNPSALVKLLKEANKGASQTGRSQAQSNARD